MAMRDLVETIRLCEIAGIRSGIATAQRLTPEVGTASMEIGGGLVAFTGVDSPLSQAYGIVGPLTAADVASITDFYETRGATPRVYVSPLADPSLGVSLAAAGYAPCEYENVLASDSFEPYARSDERIEVPRDLDEWSSASARGFIGREDLTPSDLAIARLLAYSDGCTTLEARDNGNVVATAAMDLREGCAALFAGSTLPAHRGRGWHLALIRDRIARARDAGARFLRGAAKPMSVSERNFHRCGFKTLYTRALWSRTRNAS
jgi:hypothetical protein